MLGICVKNAREKNFLEDNKLKSSVITKEDKVFKTLNYLSFGFKEKKNDFIYI